MESRLSRPATAMLDSQEEERIVIPAHRHACFEATENMCVFIKGGEPSMAHAGTPAAGARAAFRYVMNCFFGWPDYSPAAL